MTGWEIIKLIKEHKVTRVRRAGDHRIAFMAGEFSSIIKWYPIEVSNDYGDHFNNFFEMHTKWCYQYTIENFIRELLADDDWEEFQDCHCKHCLKFKDQLLFKDEE